MLFDSHCHVHEADAGYAAETDSRNRWRKGGIVDAQPVLQRARDAGIEGMITVGTTLVDSEFAVAFAQRYDDVWSSIGLHPHEARHYAGQAELLQRFAALATAQRVVAVGECGLDYYYDNSPRDQQRSVLEFQLDLAVHHGLPVVFHVREAFDDLWPIIDNFRGLRGVVHSFTANTAVLDKVLSRGLYVGLNGIMTFTKDTDQLAAARAVPLDGLMVETDAPFLTPAPLRGKMCEPQHVAVTAQFLSGLRGEPVEEFSQATTANARTLFGCV
ncbi:preprotein translocase [Candidatus Saccharibacteria bacterium]|nr:MAG: preprotein translocase [Candidatus Saccharibacteria bacterium]